MDRVDAEHFQRLDFAECAGRAQLDHIGRAAAGQDEQRRQQWTQLPHHHGDHDHSK